MANRRKAQQDYYSQDSFWTREVGGLPGWAIVLAGVALAALGVVIAVLSINQPN